MQFDKEIGMSIQEIIRAWKDSFYRESLSEEQRALLPKNPIGEVLSSEELRSISGGVGIPTGIACPQQLGTADTGGGCIMVSL